MKFQKGNKLGKKFQPGQSGNPAGRPPRWKRLAREIDAADDPFIPRASIMMAHGASYQDVLKYEAEQEANPRKRRTSPDALTKLLHYDYERASRELGKAIKALERIKV